MVADFLLNPRLLLVTCATYQNNHFVKSKFDSMMWLLVYFELMILDYDVMFLYGPLHKEKVWFYYLISFYSFCSSFNAGLLSNTF